jgi:hypothetical protein
VDSSTGTVDDTVEGDTGDTDETIEAVEETIETVDDTVESVTGEAGETVEESVAPVIKAVDDVIGAPPQPTLPGTDPIPPPTVDPAPSADDGAGNGNAGNGSDGDGSSPGDGRVGAGVVGPFVLDPPSLGTQLAVENAPVPVGFLDRLVGPAAEVASRIAFPLALAVLVLLFVAFQNRLDRRDPKLALAMTSPDVLRFG